MKTAILTIAMLCLLLPACTTQPPRPLDVTDLAEQAAVAYASDILQAPQP